MTTTATTPVPRQNMPEQAKLAFDLAERYGFYPKFDFEYPTPPDLSKRVQIRDDEHYAPKSEVTKYALAMQRGEKFPPVIFSRDGYIVDGNTRIAAAIKNKYPTIQALVLDQAYIDAPTKVRVRFYALGAGFNVRNGKGIDRAEIRTAIENLGEHPDLTATRIAALIGVTEITVRSVLSEKTARKRADRLGLEYGDMTASQMKRIGSASSALNDEPFKGVYKLAQDAGLNGRDIGAVIQKVKDAKSDEGAMQVIGQEMVARAQQIAEHRMSGRAKPAYSAQLRQRLGFVLNFEERIRELVEANPSLQREYREQIERVANILNQLLEMQIDATPSISLESHGDRPHLLS